MNDYARAILWYERARRLDPGNEDINFNLNVANTKSLTKSSPCQNYFTRNGSQTWSGYSRSTPGLLYVFACLFRIVGSCALPCLEGADPPEIGFWFALVMFFSFLLSLIFAWNGYGFANSADEAIVFTPTITVKSSLTIKVRIFSCCTKEPRSFFLTISVAGMKSALQTEVLAGFLKIRLKKSDCIFILAFVPASLQMKTPCM